MMHLLCLILLISISIFPVQPLSTNPLPPLPSGELISKLSASLSSSPPSFCRLVIKNNPPADSKAFTANPTLLSVEGRYVEIKSGPKLQLIFKETTRDLTKNVELNDDDDIDSLSSNLLPLFSHASFKTCTLQTLDGDYAFKAASTKLKTNRPTFKSLPSASHNTKKTPLIDPKSPFLNKLGLTDSEGTPKPKSKSKLSQCTKFVEIVSQLIESQKITDQKPIEIVDVGCGKGYLTFSLHNYLTSKNIETISTGVELRESLCDSINSIVSDLVETEPQFETLTFKPGYISSYVHYSKKVDVLIALHACDTASCDAISYGLSLNSTIIVLAPCCHKEVRRQVEGFKGYEGVLGEVMGWGIMRERFSEYVTDSLRGLILEYLGYEVKIFEFIGSEHTGKNSMITAVKKSKPMSEEEREKILKRILELAEGNGVTQFRLAELVGIELRGKKIKNARNMPN